MWRAIRGVVGRGDGEAVVPVRLCARALAACRFRGLYLNAQRTFPVLPVDGVRFLVTVAGAAAFRLRHLGRRKTVRIPSSPVLITGTNVKWQCAMRADESSKRKVYG